LAIAIARSAAMLPVASAAAASKPPTHSPTFIAACIAARQSTFASPNISPISVAAAAAHTRSAAHAIDATSTNATNP
jgi:hypothetical protein